MARDGEREQGNHRIVNSFKQAFPRSPETEQQKIRSYPELTDALPFKLFLVVKNQALHEERYPLVHFPLLHMTCAIVTLKTYDHKIHQNFF